MNQFEFLRYVNLGQYLPIKSLLHGLDPRARIVTYMLIIAAVTFSKSPYGLLLGLLIVLLGFALGKIPIKFALQGLIAPLPFLLIIAVLQLFITPGAEASVALWQWRFLHIYQTGVVAAGMLLLRFTVLILALQLASYTLSTSELIYGMNKLLSPLAKIGIPTHDFVMVVQITIRFIPFLAQALERIAKAQASRGADWGTKGGSLLAKAKRVIPLILPLFMTSLQRAETMAMAMDARGYGSSRMRGSYLAMRFGMADAALILFGVIAAAAILLVQYLI
ncbi:MAG TPA: energy-coupling factor transporter transmembrane component T [Bellilinea sp.]|nr:energy-coupling factor transporter transmembrane component T [Bellilinea sp.]